MLPEQIDDRFTDAGTGCQVIDGKVRTFLPGFCQGGGSGCAQSF